MPPSRGSRGSCEEVNCLQDKEARVSPGPGGLSLIPASQPTSPPSPKRWAGAFTSWLLWLGMKKLLNVFKHYNIGPIFSSYLTSPKSSLIRFILQSY